ncbi:transposase [Streptomyces sp. NBC_00243]|uniref:transposase n=1 Tax=Streptomyces sp. NBC_00243 TaxID=2975688 RepID=UPI002DD873F4|nr:transposase [Streptomyces sp. NBC_00243]WRZ22728.1 transposase [Streptomyces sp. NBC_00243]
MPSTAVSRQPQSPPERPESAHQAGSGARYAHGLRHCRYHGLARTHVQHVLTAAGTNIIRLSQCFLPGRRPPRLPRASTQFRRLCQTLTT